MNFIFLVEADHQTRGLQTEVEDDSWAVLCEATREQVEPLPKDIVDEAHQWAHFLAQDSQDSFRERLKASPPNDPTLRSILTLLISSGQFWSSELCNKDTYLKSRLGPFVNTYFNNMKFTTSAW